MRGGKVTLYFVSGIHSEVDDCMTEFFTPTRPTPVRHRPLDAFLTGAGPLPDRHIRWIKAIARVVFQASP